MFFSLRSKLAIAFAMGVALVAGLIGAPGRANELPYPSAGGTADIERHRREGNAMAEVDATIRLASAHQETGQLPRALALLEQAVAVAEKSGDPQSILLAKSSLGAVCVRVRQLDRAESLLRDSLRMAQKDGDTGMTASILNDTGTLRVARGNDTEALAAFQESVALARKDGNRLLTAQALCNAAGSAMRANNMAEANRLNQESITAINGLDASHDKALLLITAALTARQLKSETKEADNQYRLRAFQLLQDALAVAEATRDFRMSSYALGHLGDLYEQDKQLEQALTVTRRAVFQAQQAAAPEALYRWEWQSGRLLNTLGKPNDAIGSYRRALQTLQSIRQDLALGCGCLPGQPTFRESHGALFFELADALLRQAASEPDPAKSQPLLREARDTIEQLKTVELEDYFQDDCAQVVRTKTRALDSVDPHTAVVYLVPLPDRTEVLVGLSSGIRQFTARVTGAALTSEVRDLRQNLETRTTYGYLKQARQIYDWLIRPMHGLLVDNKVDTLVFVPDGALQTIPFAALHDGERFLIEQFAVAAAPGLSLVDPRPIKRENARLLLSGLSKSVQGFPSLDYVPSELKSIEPLYQSQTLLNEKFVTKGIRKELGGDSYSIVHIASHGQFRRDVSDTFLLTYDGRITMNDLEAMIRPSQYRGRPVEMLILSACQTAAGDDRAALGLAGVAVKAGARSVLATLWYVNDQSTSALVTELYQQLRNDPSQSKAKALQAAQVTLLGDKRYRHPCYWAPYLIIGNWL